MKPLVKRVNFGAPRELTFVAVQLASPAIKPVTNNKTYQWDADLALTQIDLASNILQSLFNGDVGRKPDIIAFAEYSLPPEAYDQIPFQSYADAHQCMIIAGSYFQADPRLDHYRCNICKIYVPGEPAPLWLCKASPALGEKGYLQIDDGLENVARFIWEPEGSKAVSLNVFLCRDYLQPFQSRLNDRTIIPDGEYEQVSLLDWEREGINIVVMQNDEPDLFRSAASFDIRRTHGERKLVLFVNSSNDHGRLATALIGPNPSRFGDRDVIAKLPSNAIGALVFDALLWGVAARAENPDTDLSFPVKHFESFAFQTSDVPRLSKVERDDRTPRRRGIFHPALLSALRKYIVIELFIAKSTQRVEDEIKKDRINFVTAAHVRGIEDILVVRIIGDHNLSLAPGTIPSISDPLALPYSRLSKEQFELAFDTSPHASSLKLLIDPQNIKKLRGKRFDNLTQAEYIKRCSDILLETRGRDNLEKVIEIATELPADAGIPEKFAHVFDDVENVIPVGRDNQVRETYLFVAAENDDGLPAANRLRDFVHARLIDNDQIRDIYEIRPNSLVTTPPLRGTPFQYLLRLKCSVFDADDIMRTLQSWAGQTKIRVGTRSYDAWKSIKRSALTGLIESNMPREQSELEKEIFRIDPDFAFERREISKSFSTSITRHLLKLEEIPSTTTWREAEDYFKKFMYYVCAYNCAKDAAKKRTFSEEAGTHWNRLYKMLETASHILLKATLGIKNNDRGELLNALVKKNELYFEKHPRSRDAGYFFLFSEQKEILELTNHVIKLSRSTIRVISPPRNFAVHGSAGSEIEAQISVGGKDWVALFKALDDKASAMCNMIVAFSNELHAQQLD